MARAFESLAPVIRGAIEGADTTVVTDGHYGYGPLASHGVKHECHIVNTPQRADEVLPWVHVVIANLKVWLLGTFRGVSPKHLPRYLLEFSYRFNRRGIADSPVLLPHPQGRPGEAASLRPSYS